MAQEALRYEGRDLEAMSFANRYHAWVLSFFAPYLGTRVAEVGAGSGNFSRLILAQKPLELVAIEPSREMYPRLVEHMQNEVVVHPRQALFSSVCAEYQNHFDSVVYVNVLEHIRDDAAELSYMFDALRSGGHVCIFVPALPFLYSEFDAAVGHERRYTKRELISKVRASGFEIVHARYFDIAGIVPWFVFFTLLRRTLSAGGADAYDRFVVPIMRLVESVVRPPIGKNVLLIARKP